MRQGIQSGEIIGDRYCILYELGRGRWSHTYLVREQSGKNEKAIARAVLKLFTPALPAGASPARANVLFEETAQHLARLQHSQLPQLKDFFAAPLPAQSRWCCVCECIEGVSYREILQLRWQHGRRFKEQEVLQFLGQLLPVLVYLHERDATHGNLAPENILLRQGDKLPVLIDFAAFKQAAIALEGDRSEAFYRGIPGYAPREQQEAGVVLPQSDLYALGATAIALLSGRELSPQFPAGDGSQIPVSTGFRQVLQGLLAPKPSDRFTDAETALAAVRELLGEPQSSAVAADASPQEPESSVDSTEILLPEIAPIVKSAAVPMVTEEKSQEIQEDAVLMAAVEKSQEIQEDLADSLVSQREERSQPRNKSSTRPRYNWLRAIAKFTFVCAFSLGSGLVGWWGGQRWLERQARSHASEGKPLFTDLEPEELSFLPADDPEPDPPASLPEEERERKLALRDRRLRAGLHYDFFTELTDAFFNEAYPARRGRKPSFAVEDRIWRDRWDALGTELLDRLEFLSLPARQRLGRYDFQERESASRVAASSGFSEIAFADLVAAQFAYRFPELAEREEETETSEQIQFAIAADTLRNSQLSELTPISLSQEFARVGTLQPGEARTFLVELEGGQSFSAFLDADLSIVFGLYAPDGDRLLVSPKLRSWSGYVPEDGVYTCILVSQAPSAIAYNLSLVVDSE